MRVALVVVICATISLRLMLYGLWRIGPVAGVSWNGGAKARVGSVTIGYQAENWPFERGVISDDGLVLECPFINAGPFFLQLLPSAHSIHRCLTLAKVLHLQTNRYLVKSVEWDRRRLPKR